MFRFDAIEASEARQIKEKLKDTLSLKYSDIFPQDKSVLVLLKPNLNANMNALTGNTTDLRVTAAVIEYLKDLGYKNVLIGEGTNSGYYRNRISVISRLMYDGIAKHYGIEIRDLNYSEPVEIEFADGVKASLALECMEAGLFINLPKLKTHFENGMSVCLKNLMGCLVGQENKKKTHKSLAANILNINKALKPHLHVVDAVISMEGLGPTRGTPIKTSSIMVGTDPYLIDLIAARFAGFDYRKVRTLFEAEGQGIITKEHHEFAKDYPLKKTYKFKPPKAGAIATFIHSPKRQKYFLAIRNTALFNYLCSTKVAGKLLYATGLRQDVFIDEDTEIQGIELDRTKCNDCGKC